MSPASSSDKTAETTGESTLSDAGLYARIVEEIRDAALTSAEIAEVTGVDERQVYNWAAGTSRPKGLKRDRLLEVHYILQALRDVYTQEGSEIWIHARNRSLSGQRPIDLLIAGDFQPVLLAVERLRTGAM
jgi:DNA-binding transcriptional regulator YiaG